MRTIDQPLPFRPLADRARPGIRIGTIPDSVCIPERNRLIRDCSDKGGGLTLRMKNHADPEPLRDVFLAPTARQALPVPLLDSCAAAAETPAGASDEVARLSAFPEA